MDAICLHQGDGEGKCHQIFFVRNTNKNVTCVFGWLGVSWNNNEAMTDLEDKFVLI